MDWVWIDTISRLPLGRRSWSSCASGTCLVCVPTLRSSKDIPAYHQQLAKLGDTVDTVMTAEAHRGRVDGVVDCTRRVKQQKRRSFGFLRPRAAPSREHRLWLFQNKPITKMFEFFALRRLNHPVSPDGFSQTTRAARPIAASRPSDWCCMPWTRFPRRWCWRQRPERGINPPASSSSFTGATRARYSACSSTTTPRWPSLRWSRCWCCFCRGIISRVEDVAGSDCVRPDLPVASSAA